MALDGFGVTPQSPRVEFKLSEKFYTPAERQLIEDEGQELWLLIVRMEGTALPSLPVFDNRRRIEKALDLLGRIEHLASKRQSYHLLRAELLEGLDRKDEAAKVRAAMPKVPADAADYYQLGLTRMNDLNFDAAVDAFEQAILRTPDHFGSHLQIATAKLRQSSQNPTAAAAQDRLGSAKAHLDACLSQFKEDRTALTLRGYTHTELGYQRQLAARNAQQRGRTQGAPARSRGPLQGSGNRFLPRSEGHTRRGRQVCRPHQSRPAPLPSDAAR